MQVHDTHKNEQTTYPRQTLAKNPDLIIKEPQL